MMKFIPDTQSLKFTPDDNSIQTDISPVGLGAKVGQMVSPTVNPAIAEGLKTLFQKYPASIRERVRSLGKTGDINEANKNADIAYNSPSLSGSFQDEDIQNTNNFLDKTKFPILNQVKNLPEIPQTAARFAAGVVPSAIGMAEDFATNPGQIGLALATEGASKGLSEIPVKGLTLGERAENLPISKFFASQEGQTGKAADLTNKMYDKTVGLLKPSKTKLNENPFSLPEVTEPMQTIQKAKDYGELSKQLNISKQTPMEERSELYSTGKVDPNTSHLTDAQKFYDTAASDPRTKPTDLRKMKGVLDREKAFVEKSTPKQLNDPDFLQTQKEKYQDMTKPLYKKADAGTLTDHENSELEMYKKLASGYQNKLETISGRVKPLNRQFQGHNTAEDLATNLMNVSKLHPEARSIDDLIDIMEAGKTTKLGAARAFLSKVPGLKRLAGRNVEGETSGIVSLRNQSGKAQNLADLLQSIKEARNSPKSVGAMAADDFSNFPTGPSSENQLPFGRARQIKLGELQGALKDALAKGNQRAVQNIQSEIDKLG